MSILKVGITIVPLFFLNSYSLVPKLVICLKYFLNKDDNTQTLCAEE